jgi:esterase/lipase superfamily enzyme
VTATRPRQQDGDVERAQYELPLGSGIDRGMTVVRYGHYGRPVVVFPSEAGRAWDFEQNGMVDAVGPLLQEGRIKLFCVDSLDADTWSDQTLPTEERARRHSIYTRWLIDTLVPSVHADTVPGAELITTGCSLGAYHAVHVPNLEGDHLDWLRSRLSVLLVVGQGAWETHPTGALPSTLRTADMLQERGIRCELDLWGHDVSHDWVWWQRQLAHHLPRFC